MNCERKFNNKDKVVEMVCTKAEVKHADMTSKRAGMLMMKRTKCVSTDGDTFKCAVFKAGQCIDVGEDVWSHYFNDPMHVDGTYRAGAKAFAAKATQILAAHRDKDLPTKYKCVNNRHKYWDTC